MKANGSESNVRPAAVAGLFYPEASSDLRAAVKAHLAGPRPAFPMPKALIVPHAGYIYSGAVAGKAYASLKSGAGSLRRVVLLGPSHRTWFRGLAIPSVRAFQTPLGEVSLEQAALGHLRGLPEVVVSDEPHALEHSLEVQLPFIQQLAPKAAIVPIVAGQALPSEVDAVLNVLWDGDETLIVVSSDLSHYLPYESARGRDRDTARAIVELQATLVPEEACGAAPINGLLRAARRHGMAAELVDLRNSGDTAGDRSRVVGYGAFAFTEGAGG